MLYKGSCHCGSVAYEVEGEIDSGLSCNCSMCRRKAALMWFVPRAQLKVNQGEATLATYTFNHHVIKHRFCPTCGIHTFGEGVDPKGNAMAAINLNCLEDLDLEKIPVHHYDGRSK
jgi:hypothetical protein